MISLAEARNLIQANIRPLAAQTLPLAEAHGHVLHEDVQAREDMPAFDRSAMDGYAVALDDNAPRFRVVGEIQPGAVPALKIKRGEAARIFTGAQIPEGASQVIMQEHVRVENEFVVPTQRNRSSNIRRRGEDCRKGDLLMHAGSRLGPGELSLLASLGVMQPKVAPFCRVAHFATGNELVDPTQTPEPGQIRDSNSTLVAAFVQAHGGELVRQERVADDFELLLERVRALEGEARTVAVQSAADILSAEPSKKNEIGSAGWKPAARSQAVQFDLLLVSGGASVGDYDFGKRLLTTLGFQIHFEKMKLRPGKPTIFATRGAQAAFILPGNPVSHFVVLNVAVKLALEMFKGTTASWPLAKMRLGAALNYRADARETYWPARIAVENGELVVRALRWQSSGDVTGLVGANALLRLADTTQPLEVGSLVDVLFLNLP